MKKLLTIILSLIFACGCVFVFGCGDTPVKPPDGGIIEPPDDGADKDKYALTFRAVEEDGVAVGYAVSGVEIVGKKENPETVIPAEHENAPVIAIDGGAFDGCGWMTSITLPKSISAIGANAFARCENLKRVYISDVEQWLNISFESMASNPLYFATELYLNGAPLENLVIPDSVTAVPDFAFYECSTLKSVTVGKGVTSLGYSPFYNCENLERVVLNGNLEYMGELAFAHCQKLETVEIGDGVEEIGYYAFYECGALREITIPSCVKSIGESAFSMCSSLEKINFNEGLEYIGDCAFVGCASLEEFIMPNSVTEIGFGILMFIGGYMFEDGMADGTCAIKKVVMSDSLKVIPQFAFSGCTMASVTIGKSVETIDYSAFYGCYNLESVVLSDSVKEIISYAFYGCPLLKTVYYEGTAEELTKVSISRNGNDIVSCEAYYYSENEPSASGKYWHYAPDGVTPEKW